MKKILASMLSAAIVSAMLLTGCGSSGQRAGSRRIRRRLHPRRGQYRSTADRLSDQTDQYD